MCEGEGKCVQGEGKSGGGVEGGHCFHPCKHAGARVDVLVRTHSSLCTQALTPARHTHTHTHTHLAAMTHPSSFLGQ